MIYSIGVLVEVDDAKTGYIIDIDNTDIDNVVFKINYTVGNEIEESVSQSRCRPVNHVIHAVDRRSIVAGGADALRERQKTAQRVLHRREAGEKGR